MIFALFKVVFKTRLKPLSLVQNLFKISLLSRKIIKILIVSIIKY